MFSVFITISSKKDSDGTATIFNYQLRFVKSASMESCEYVDTSNFEIKDIKVKSCIFIETVPEDDKEADDWYASLKVGDVLTFKYVYTKQETITHRIVDITKKSNDGYIIKLQGDNRNDKDGTLIQVIDTSLTNSNNYVIGKVVGKSYVLGLVIYALKTPVGIICIFIIPCVLIIIFEIIKIVKVFTLEKKEKLEQESFSKDKEIEELKKKLENLQKDKESDGE